MLSKMTVLASFLVMLAGCSVSRGSQERYAVLLSEKSKIVRIDIRDSVWIGFWGPDGPGGFRENTYFSVEAGDGGPVFKNPIFINHDGPFDDKGYRIPLETKGVVTIDEVHSKVIIEMMVNVAKEEDPKGWISSSANGTYPIKRSESMSK
jgi:hypothetical protein